jgi:glycosyltransferase involved in cell wall biosynthesis
MIKISEYLAAHRPVVANALDETRFTAGEAALYAPCDRPEVLAELVARLARDDSLRGQLAAHAAERVGDLFWERSEERLVSAYAQLAGEVR